MTEERAVVGSKEDDVKWRDGAHAQGLVGRYEHFDSWLATVKVVFFGYFLVPVSVHGRGTCRKDETASNLMRIRNKARRMGRKLRAKSARVICTEEKEKR